MDIAPSKCQNSRYIMYLENFLSQNSVTNFTDEPYLCPPVAQVFGAQVYASASFGAAKPSPELYRRCVAHLGVAPTETFFIDDVEANVAGAIEAGLRAYRFIGNEALARELAYHRLL
jgi:HAD superfamily hydrolase (TIGR01509 family)